MHTQKEGVPIKNRSRKSGKNKVESGEQERKGCTIGENDRSPDAVVIPESTGEQKVFVETGFTTLHEQGRIKGGGTCVLVDRISDGSQILTGKARIAANCAVRTAMAAKNGIDMVEKVVKCMRIITGSMNDVVESVEKLGQRVRNIENAAITVGDTKKRADIIARSAVQKSAKHDNQSEEVHVMSECFISLLADIEECIKTSNTTARRIEESYRTANEARIAMETVMDLVEEVSRQIDDISEITNEVDTNSTDMIYVVDNLVREVTGSSEQLKKISGELNDYIERFQSYGRLMDTIAMKAAGTDDSNRMKSSGDREYSVVNSIW